MNLQVLDQCVSHQPQFGRTYCAPHRAANEIDGQRCNGTYFYNPTPTRRYSAPGSLTSLQGRRGSAVKIGRHPVRHPQYPLQHDLSQPGPVANAEALVRRSGLGRNDHRLYALQTPMHVPGYDQSVPADKRPLTGTELTVDGDLTALP